MSEGKCPIQHVDPQTLTNLTSRINYLKSFIQFTETDGASIQASKDLIAPALPAILDGIYTHLLSYDITAKAFVPRQQENGDGPDTNGTKVSDLSLEHPNIVYRKDFLKNYLVKLVSNSDWSDESKFWEYLDRVGLMHTGDPGFKHRAKRPELRVEVMHCSILLGHVEDIVLKAVMGAEVLDLETKTAVIRAFNKVLWIQNDLFTRHYVIDLDARTLPKGDPAKLMEKNGGAEEAQKV
ncbi:hypothetical protein FQN54_008417 [Arachnomyces sp. PD_36]|nr:hypothetical protein FQN54_008417 [Arachnomyces sp. PD_36]